MRNNKGENQHIIHIVKHADAYIGNNRHQTSHMETWRRNQGQRQTFIKEK